MLEKKYIKLKLTGKTKDEILQELVDVLDNGGALEDKNEFLKVVKAREATSSTGLEEGIAIPHGKTKAVKKPAVAFGRSHGVDFNSLDGCLLYTSNDKYGQESGDYILKIVGQNLKNIFKNQNIYRISGDEFFIFSENDFLIEKLERLKEKLHSLKLSYQVNLSIGFYKKDEKVNLETSFKLSLIHI